LGPLGFAWDVLPLVVFAISFARDPRKVRTGVYLLIALAWLALLALGWLLTVGTAVLPGMAGGALLLGAAALVVLALAGLCWFLIHTGVVLVSKEGVSPSHLLSLVLGVLLLGYLGAVALAVLRTDATVFGWLFLLGLPAGYLAFGFAAFVLYGALYPAWMARFGQPPAVVIVLGSGLIDGQVPPLLAARLRRGRAVFDKALKRRGDVRMLTSGGKGADEPVAEADAMRDYLIADGFDHAVLVEDRSANTEENLAFSAELLGTQGLDGPVAVVTSDFHALRAALQLRKAGLPGYSIGARTPRYYWPAAVIREYAAILRDHFWLNAVLVATASLPLLIAMLGWLR
jgi:Uncharacterized conserved protein